jgi:hypothetical protein
MTTPLSINLEKAIVPIKVRIPIRRITSIKAWVFNRTEITAVIDMRLIPMESKATTRSDIDGPTMTRYKQLTIDIDNKTRAS